VHPIPSNCDHLSSAEIREKYRNWNVDTSAIEEVDVVWKSGSLTDAYEQAQRSHVTGLYQDTHAWQFTPESFNLIIKELNHLSLISLVDVISYPTAGFEFYVTLQVCPFGVESCKLSRADRDAMVSASYSPKL
jgi:hypothetical protein